MLLFRKKNEYDLPMASYNSSAGDGSGRSVHMDAPIVRAWKNSSSGTKGTVYAMLVSLFLIFFGYKHLRYHHASIWLTCHAQECTLDITPNGRRGTISVTLKRKQIAKSQTVKVDSQNNFVHVDNSPMSQTYGKKKKYKKGASNSRGPDKDGNYDSYTIHLQPPLQDDEDTKEFVEFRPQLDKYLYPARDGSNTFVLGMRQFNLGQSKRRTRTMVTKIDSYIKERRHKLTVKENSGLSWQGILSLIVGIFMLLMTILMGTMFQEESRSTVRTRPTTRKKSSTSKKQPGNYMGATTRGGGRPMMAPSTNRNNNTNTSMRYRTSSNTTQRKQY